MTALDPRRTLLPLSVASAPHALLRALSQEGIPWCRRDGAHEPTRFVLYDSRHGRPGSLLAGQVPLDVAELIEPGQPDPFRALNDDRSARAHWQVAGLRVGEDVARVDKRAVRAGLLSRLRWRIEEAGGVWVRLGPWPFPYRSVFCLRIDHDEYEPADFQRLTAALAGWEHATTHFVCASTHVAHAEALAWLRGVDVGSHGYFHHTYAEASENLHNIRRGIEALRAVGIEPSGFAAPHGRFHQGLFAALEQLGITHSSEFALAYDEWPFFVDRWLLQVPVHPVCLGIVLEAHQQLAPSAARTIEEVVAAAADYFCQVAECKYAAGEPVLLYGHPDGRLGRYPELVRAVLETVGRFAAVWPTNYTQIARWWRTRDRVRLRVTGDAQSFAIEVVQRQREFRLAGEYWRGDHVAVVPLDHHVVRLQPGAMAFQSRQHRPLPRPVRIDGRQPLRGRLARWIDWERATPIEEISTRTWRGWLKRRLRQWRA